MKIRSDQELLDFVSRDSKRRKIELISIKGDLTPARGDVPTRLIRASIVMSYANWEGFVKEAARAYVSLVSNKSRALSSLSSNFQALMCRQEIQNAHHSTRKIAPHIVVVELLTDQLHQSVTIDPTKAIDTESNLKSGVFENICQCIGVDYKANWSVEKSFIDELFENRCTIAHGGHFVPELKYSLEVVEKVIKWIDSFSTDIENAAINKAYLRQ